ncbi:MAG: tyrosine-type recombinase/integrase [Bdellovibrionales bacterium]|nr:tyrosine-type recombinase/integrase [Bdellovibrionales bacterium]
MMLKYWVEFFDELQNVRGRSLNTVMAYRRDLELYAEFQVQNKELNQFFDFMKDRNLSVRSQARVISSLRTYFRFLENKGEKALELRQLRQPKIKNKLPKVLSENDFKRLYEACENENSFRAARNQITLLLLFGLGCRVSELVQLNLQDFNELECWLIVTGKGNKQRVVPLTSRLVTELKDYLEKIRPHLIKETNSAILINDRGHRPSRIDIWRWLSAWSKIAGFESSVSPHQFRHGCATSLLDNGADLRTIQMLLGHASIQTTQIYTTVSRRKITEELEIHHPLANVKNI